MLEPGTLEALGLIVARTSAAILFSPIFGVGLSFRGPKIALILGISTLVYVTVGEPLGQHGTWGYGVLAGREIVIGLFMGFVFQVVLLAVRVGGEMIGHEMGMFMARQADPETGVAVTLVSKIYENFFLLALLAVNGHHVVVRSLTESFTRAPVGHLSSTGSMSGVARSMLSEMFAAGLAFAAPVMILLMLVSILLGILARVVPQLNIMEVSFSARIALALVTMYLFAPMLEPALDDLLGRFELWLGYSLDALEG